MLCGLGIHLQDVAYSRLVGNGARSPSTELEKTLQGVQRSHLHQPHHNPLQITGLLNQISRLEDFKGGGR